MAWLDKAVEHRGDAKGARLAVALGDLHALDRARAVVPRFAALHDANVSLNSGIVEEPSLP